MLAKIKKHPKFVCVFPHGSKQRLIVRRVSTTLFPLHSRRRFRAVSLANHCIAIAESLAALMQVARRQGLKSVWRHLRYEWQKRNNPEAGDEIIPDPVLPDMLRLSCPKSIPKVSIISIAYRKERELPYFLESLFRQDYPGELELVLINDKSPDASAAVATESFALLQKQYPLRSIEMRILSNQQNLGNCESRNKGIAASDGDILLIADADCLLNSSCITRHALAQIQGSFDVSIGALNLETGSAQPIQALRHYESDISRVFNEALPQDELCPTGFVNCITRNFCIRKSVAPTPLFDTAFGYSAAPDSGIGWEDVEMGRRLYDAGLRIVYIPQAFSVHVSHPANTNEHTKPARALRNFRKLLDKHPDISFSAARWAWKTFEAHLAMPGANFAHDDTDRKAIESILEHSPANTRPVHRQGKRLRILTYHWHTSHQYELFKLPHDFFLLKGIGHPFGEEWNYNKRPKPANVHYLNVSDFHEKDYDLAIVPFDENILAPQNCNGLLPQDWGACFKWVSNNISLPKIGLCHGSPQFYGQCLFLYSESDRMKTREEERQRLVDATQKFKLVVCNSHQVRSTWKFTNSRTIWHGMDAMEFPPRRVDASGILTMSIPPMITRPFCNGYFIYRFVQNLLPDDINIQSTLTPDPQHCTQTPNFYARAKFCNFVDSMRNCSVFFNPTNTSPMPRSRAEAMLCGLVSVSMHNHDVDMFIENGANGFYGSTPEELAEYLTFCIRNPDAARRIGFAGRQTACKLFGIDRYLAEWQSVLNSI